VTIEELGFLLLPADDPATGRIVRPDDLWRMDPDAAGDVATVVWGREPLPSGTPLGRAAWTAVARERSILRLRTRPPRGLRVTGVHRWAPPRLRGGGARNGARDLVLGGAVVELGRPTREARVLDAAADAAAWPTRIERFHPGSGGSVLVRKTDRILRVGRAGGSADPGANADALVRLGSADRAGALVASVLGRGGIAGATWTVESRLPGRRPHRLDPGLARQVAAFAAALPRGEGPATAHHDDLRALSRALPGCASPLGRLGDRLDRAAVHLPAVLRHGDLWAGNLLVDGSGLSGVVDWDAWHPSAFPGTDVLHAVATEEALRTHRGIGAEWQRRVWRGPAFERATAEYWPALGLRPSVEQLDAVGHAWWAGQLAATLRRIPGLTRDPAWMAQNVGSVLDRLES
jgi:hypothetical protein